jgi:adenylylsulfate kinase
VSRRRVPFAVWLTGLPASGKSTVAGELCALLADAGIPVERLESDAVRATLSPAPDYKNAGRDAFYAELLRLGLEALGRGACVVFDATANRQAYRDQARERIGRFLEVYVSTPLSVCVGRDPKGIYRRAQAGEIGNVPGIDAPYEAPPAAEVVVDGSREDAAAAARRILDALSERGWMGEK